LDCQYALSANGDGFKWSLGVTPIQVSHSGADSQHFGRLRTGQTGKVPQFDQLRLSWMFRGQPVESFMQGDQFQIGVEALLGNLASFQWTSVDLRQNLRHIRQ
jgi:hypothetical protein